MFATLGLHHGSTHQIHAFGFIQTEEGATTIELISIRQRLIRFGSGGAGLQDAVGFHSHRVDEFSTVGIRIGQGAKRVILRNTSHGHEVKRCLRQSQRGHEVDPNLYRSPKCPRFERDRGRVDIDRVLKLVQQRLAVGLQLDVIKLLDPDGCIVRGLSHQG